jgi:hypothetical protein
VADEIKGTEKETEDRKGDNPMGAEGVSQKFKKAFERLLSEIRAAREGNRKTNSKDIALRCIEMLRMEITPA